MHADQIEGDHLVQYSHAVPLVPKPPVLTTAWRPLGQTGGLGRDGEQTLVPGKYIWAERIGPLIVLYRKRGAGIWNQYKRSNPTHTKPV